MNTSLDQWMDRDRQLSAEAEDLRAEVVLAEFVLAGQATLDEFLMWPNGGFRRSAERDVHHLHPPGTYEWAPHHAVVELNRPGVYDSLPEGVFHPVVRTQPFVSADAAVSEIRKNDEIEEAARLFFLPLDDELLRARLHIEITERSLTAELLKDRTGHGVKEFWDPPHELSAKEVSKLLMYLPKVHKITGSLGAMARFLTVILCIPAVIEHVYMMHRIGIDGSSLALEGSTLGVDSVLHGAQAEHIRGLRVTLGPLAPEVANGFASGQQGLVKLSKLMEYACAADQVWEVVVLLQAADAEVYLDVNGISCRLGLSSVLN